MSEEIEAVRCGELDDAAHDGEDRPAHEKRIPLDQIER